MKLILISLTLFTLLTGCATQKVQPKSTKFNQWVLVQGDTTTVLRETTASEQQTVMALTRSWGR